MNATHTPQRFTLATAAKLGLSAVWLGVCPLSLAEVTVTGKTLNASFDDVTLEDALSEIATTTGIEITTSQALEQKLSVSYQNITPAKLLKRLLHGYNAIYLQHPQTGQLNKIRIFATGKPPVIAQKAPIDLPTEAQEENGKYYLTVLINGKAVKMLVDTGANTLALSAKIAAALGITGGQSTAVQTAGGSANAFRATIDSVAMAGKELKGVQAIILPNLQENGLIGQNVLAHYRRTTSEGKMRFEAMGVKPKQPPQATPTNPQTQAPANNGNAVPQPKNAANPAAASN